MNETTPKYIKELEINLRNHIENHIDFSINELAIMIKDNFATKDDIEDMVRKSDIEDMVRKSDIVDMVRKSDIEDMATKYDIKDMATKQDVEKILSHIGRYEIRAQNIEETLIQDHKPRISDLEKEVFA